MNQACERCAKRKAKCDGQDPCSRCAESRARCAYAIARKRGPKRKQATDDDADEQQGEQVHRLLPPALCKHLVGVCQAFVTVSWPIIYAPALSSLSTLGDTRPGLYSALLLSSTAISPQTQQQGSISIQASRQKLLEHVQSYFDVQGGVQCSEPSLALVQALLFVTSYYIGAGKITVAWNHCGLACRMALSMSLHQSARSSGQKPKARMEEQEERRTFWGLYVMEQVVSYLLRLPPLLRAEDADRELPDVEERDEYELWLNSQSRPLISPLQARAMVGVRTHALSSFLAWVQVMKEHEGIRKDLKRDLPSGTGAFERYFTERSQRLHAFKDQLPTHLQWDSPFIDAKADDSQGQGFDAGFSVARDSHASVAPQILLMRAWFCECCILLHRPCVGTGERGSYSARRCLCAATEVCAIVSAYERTFGMDLMPSGFIQILFQGATLLAAMESVYQMYGPNFWTPPLPLFPLGQLFDACFNWLQTLSTRFPFANHYLSILASLSKAQAHTWQGSAAAEGPSTHPTPDPAPRPQPMLLPAMAMHPSSSQPSFNTSRYVSTPSQQASAPLPDGFWDIAPFAGENLNEWLSGIESYVPM